MELKYHTPVFLKEILQYLNLTAGKIIVDATAGTAGHSQEIIKSILPGGRLVCIDRDEDSLAIAKERLHDFQDVSVFMHANFLDLDVVLDKLHIKKIDGILFDLGISSFQLDNPQRGFSFQNEGPLDMRIDQNSYISAYDLINNLNEDELSGLLWNFGQERWHNRIARYLVQERQKHPISTTLQLSEIVVRAIPHKYRHYKIHPATRTFQAVRIAVNRELEILELAIEKAIRFLNKHGRICVISFHSLEDRIIKLSFRKNAAAGILKVLTPKPQGPTLSEIKDNPSSRSAKLRVAERVMD